MFSIAFLVGLYAKGLFFLGLLQLYSLQSVLIYTIIFVIAAKIFWKYFDEDINLKKAVLELKKEISKQKMLGVLLVAFLSVIIIGVMTPETAFDALWYHLTFPKLYLLNGGITFIPGSLFYYSVLPKIGELLFLLPVGLHFEQLAKMIHAVFALLTCVALYLIAKSQTNKRLALLSVIIFLSNIVVLWQATTAYIDLIRTFFETLSLYGILLYQSTKKRKWIIESAVCMGLAIETKLIAVGTLAAHSLLILLVGGIRKGSFKNILIFVSMALLIPMPWFVLSFLHTGNPIYPIFSGYPMLIDLNPLILLKQTLLVLIASSDPISPIYIALIPIIPIVWKKLSKIHKKLFILSLFCLFIWMITPRTGGGRFIMPYLPLFSLCVVIVVNKLKPVFGKALYVFILISSLLAISYRGIAEIDRLKVIMGQQTKDEYLTTHLNFNFGDFYDTDGYFKDNLQESDKVLLVGFHNLYYVDFPFIDQSYQRDSDVFTHVATQNANLPYEYREWLLVYSNPVTNVRLYQNPWRGKSE